MFLARSMLKLIYFSEHSGTFCREKAVGGLSWSHSGISQIKDSIGDIWNFSPCWSGFGLHRLKHLGSTDYVFPSIYSFVHNVFLHQNYLLNRNFHSQIPSGNHNAIWTSNYFVQIMDSLMTFYFADEMDIRPMLWIFRKHEFPQLD